MEYIEDSDTRTLRESNLQLLFSKDVFIVIFPSSVGADSYQQNAISRTKIYVSHNATQFNVQSSAMNYLLGIEISNMIF
jgi:hypothetical protein